jgi:hypothetical protein
VNNPRLIYDLDPQFSECARKDIITVVQSSLHHSLPTLCQTIKDSCHAVDSVAVEKLASGFLVIHADAKRADALIGTSQILLADGSFVPCSLFDQKSIAALEKISVEQERNSYSLAFGKWLAARDATIKEKYQACWFDDYEIMLIHKERPDLRILCTIHDAPHEKMMDQCVQLLEHQKEKNKNKMNCCADIRFEKQIVICSRKGGAEYG